MNTDDFDKIAELDLYDILDVSKDATKTDIKTNYKQLVKVLHPDKKSGDGEAFQYVNLAYTILKDKRTRKIYNKRRKEYLESSSTHVNLKDNFNDFSNPQLRKEEAQKLFFKLENQLNEKHGFNRNDINKITSGKMKSRLDKLVNDRNEYYEHVKKNTVKRNLSDDDFNQVFIDESKKKFDNTTQEITAFNDGMGMGLTCYNSVNNFDLYASSGTNTTSYCSLKEAYEQPLPNNISNSYSSHNVLPKDYKKTVQERMQKYNNLTEQLKNRKLNDY